MKRLFALMLLACPAAAQSIPDGSSVAQVLATARTECKAADPGAPGTLDIQPAAITWTDLDGDGDRDDAVVDFNHVYCSSGPLWQGTGGAPIHVLTDAAMGGAGQVYTGWNWQVIGHGDRPVFLMSRHGTYCDAGGADACTLAVTFSGAGALIATGDEN